MHAFWVYFPVIAAAVVWNAVSGGEPPAVWAAALAGGLLLWTPIEYLMHRYLLHRLAPHYEHHDKPEAVEYIFAPLTLSAPAALLLWAILGWALGSWRLAALVGAGTLGGYVAYEFVHGAIHSRKAGGRLLRALRKHHFYHHYADDTRCYGVTSAFWDRIFRTGV